MNFFVKGVLLGFSVAAPVGPIGILCIHRTLRCSRLHGLLTGLGAATADAMYGVVAGFGLAAISLALIEHQTPIRLFGGFFLLYLGMKTFVSKPQDSQQTGNADSLSSAYLSALALTVTNPMTIFSFIAAFAAMGLGGKADSGYASATSLVFGVFAGSALWWLLLSSVTGAFRTRLTTQRMQWINRLSGTSIMVFGALAIVRGFWN